MSPQNLEISDRKENLDRMDLLLITEERHHDRREPVPETNGCGSGSTMMTDCLDSALGEKPIVGNIS